MLYGQLPEQTVDEKTVNAIKITIPNPPKTAFLRLPSGPELLDYFKPAKGAKKDTTPEQKALDLFKKIRVDEGPEFDEFEASSAIDAIMRSRGTGYERVGDAYQIAVETPFNTTLHTLSIPTQKQLTLFRRCAVKNYLTAVIALYEELVQKTEGYVPEITAKDIPPHHKLDSINQVFAALDTLDPLVSMDPNS